MAITYSGSCRPILCILHVLLVEALMDFGAIELLVFYLLIVGLLQACQTRVIGLAV